MLLFIFVPDNTITIKYKSIMKNFDCITPNKEHLLICFFLCLALGLYADEKIDSIKAKEVPVVSDTVLRSIQYPTNTLILPGVVV